jgi:hypothetical protein
MQFNGIDVSSSDAWDPFYESIIIILSPFYKSIHVHKVESNIKYTNSQTFNLTRSLQPYGLTAIARDREESHIAFGKQRQMRFCIPCCE